ncbi:MAG: hypothetical protein VKQ33_03790 [Candidatus Sericytochromatia bacterium]|nr:hypothetical protein [Candidatus Sericytochromatia bacterium]
MAQTPQTAEAEARRPDPASFRDPSGTVVWQAGKLTRQIRPGAAPFFRTLAASPALARWVAAGLLVPTWVERDDDAGLVLGHDPIAPLTYPHEWPGALFHDAASVVLQVAQAAAEEGLGLADGHPWNVLIHRGRPTFIDVGSLGPEPTDLLWPAHQQFLAFCLYPLHLRRAGLPELATAQLHDLSQGISDDLCLRALPLSYLAGHPGLWGSLQLRRWLSPGRTAPRARAATSRPDPATLRQVRRPFFARLQRELAALRPSPGPSAWSGYYETCPGMSGDEQQAKLQVVARLLEAWRPQRVLDLGCNRGAYAVLAARQGASVVAVDQDDEALSHLYRQARQDGLDILPLHLNMCHPSAGAGWNGQERPATWERLSGDVTLMLALLHHLLITHQLKVTHVADLAARVTRRCALIEWVDLEDPMSQVLLATARREFPEHNLALLVEAMAARGFTRGEVVPLTATRRLVSFERR